jgi:hypothetical protein
MTLDDYLVMYNQDREGVGTLVTALPQKSQGELLTVCGCSLYGVVERLPEGPEAASPPTQKDKTGQQTGALRLGDVK